MGEPENTINSQSSDTHENTQTLLPPDFSPTYHYRLASTLSFHTQAQYLAKQAVQAAGNRSADFIITAHAKQVGQFGSPFCVPISIPFAIMASTSAAS